MAASFPTTCAPTWINISHITGLTFPGMIEDPGCVAGTFGWVMLVESCWLGHAVSAARPLEGADLPPGPCRE